MYKFYTLLTNCRKTALSYTEIFFTQLAILLQLKFTGYHSVIVHSCNFSQRVRPPLGGGTSAHACITQRDGVAARWSRIYCDKTAEATRPTYHHHHYRLLHQVKVYKITKQIKYKMQMEQAKS